MVKRLRLCAGALLALLLCAAIAFAVVPWGVRANAADGDATDAAVVVLDKLEDFRVTPDVVEAGAKQTYSIIGSDKDGAFHTYNANDCALITETGLSDSAMRKIMGKDAAYNGELEKDVDETEDAFALRVTNKLFYELMSGEYSNKTIKIVIPHNISYIGSYAFVVARWAPDSGNMPFGYVGIEDMMYGMFGDQIDDMTDEEIAELIETFPYLLGLGAFEDPEYYYQPPKLVDVEFAVDNNNSRSLGSEKAVAYGVFGTCSLNSFTMPAGVKMNNSFVAMQYASLKYEEGTTEIPASACASNLKLKSVVIPETVESIGNNAFSGCANLTDITITGENTDIAFNAFGTGATAEVAVRIKSVEQWFSLKFAAVTSNPLLSSEGGSKLYVKNTSDEWTALNNIEIPATITTIPDNAFAGCSFDKLTFLGEIDSIGAGAFYNCKDLKTVVMTSVKTMGERAFERSGLTEVEIPNTLEVIPASAFLGCRSLEKVTFASPSKVTEIGANAFSGNDHGFAATTPLKTLTIPKSVKKICNNAFDSLPYLEEVLFEEGSELTEIGQSAFWSCYKLTRITLPSTVTTVGREAFFHCGYDRSVGIDRGFRLDITGEIMSVDRLFARDAVPRAKSATVVCSSKTIYDGFVSLYGTIAEKEVGSEDGKSTFITYPVTIKFMHDGHEIANRKSYLYAYDVPDTISVPSFASWTSEKSGNAVTGGTLWQAISGNTDVDIIDDNGEIVLNAKLENYARPFIARSDIEYDGVEYGLNEELNALLSSDGALITEDTAVTITSYTDALGNVSQTLPDNVCNAGTYGMRAAYGGRDYDFEITVRRKRVDVSSLIFNVTVDGNGSPELLDSATLYLYIDGKGQTYASLGRLDTSLSEYSQYTWYNTVTAAQSIVQYRGMNAQYELGAEFAGVNVDITSGNSAGDCGAFTAVATVSATDNYEPYAGGGNNERYGITVTDNHNGTYTVSKRWYVVSMGNWLVTSADATENDYALYRPFAGFVFGSVPQFAIPYVMRGDVAAAEFGKPVDPLTFTLYYGGSTKIGEFSRADYVRYINSAMPVGKYTLAVNVSDVVSGNGKIGGFTREYEFEVFAKAMPENELNALKTALGNKTFAFDYDGAMHILTDEAAKAVSALESAIAAMQPDRSGTVWASAEYNEYYGNFKITFNLNRMGTATYFTENDLNGESDKPVSPDKYTVYYMLTANNYESLVSGALSTSAYDAARRQYVFYVKIVREIEIPTANRVMYNGSSQKADIASSEYYTVKEYEGFTAAGTHGITLTLVNSDYYRWKGKELGEATATVSFEIMKGSNEFIEAPDVVRWIEGKYNEEENKFIGAAKFGEISYVVTDSNDNVIYDLSQGINKLANAKAGTYILKATVAGNDDYNSLTEAFTIRILEKLGMPWWGTLLIVIGVLIVVAGVIFALWKKGVFQILTGKIVLAIRTRATVDATIAAVRANKRAEEAKISIAKAQARERAEARKAAAEEEKNKPAEERAAALEEKAAAAVLRAEKLRARAEAMQARAERMKAQAHPVEEAAATKEE